MNYLTNLRHYPFCIPLHLMKIHCRLQFLNNHRLLTLQYYLLLFYFPLSLHAKLPLWNLYFPKTNEKHFMFINCHQIFLFDEKLVSYVFMPYQIQLKAYYSIDWLQLFKFCLQYLFITLLLVEKTCPINNKNQV